MATLTESKHPGEFLISEAPGYRSREEVTVASGANLVPGTVLGKNTSSTVGSAAAATGNTGNGTVGSITAGLDTKEGTYTLRCIEADTDAGEFEVRNPDGALIGVSTVAVAFEHPELNFTIADGSTDFAVGDEFTIAVSGTDQYAQLDQDAVTGISHFGGILYGHALAASANVDAVIIDSDAEVRGDDLTWPGDITTDEKNAVIDEMKEQHNIKVRS